MTHVIYLKDQAVRSEQRTSTSNKPIRILYSKEKNRQDKRYNLISHLVSTECSSKGAIKLALSNYQPINQLEYE